LSSEEHKREPDSGDDGRELGSGEGREPLEQAQGSPEDPASLGEPGEDSGTIEDSSASPAPETSVDEEDDEEPHEEPHIAEQQLAAVVAQLETARRERDEYLDALRRLKAEFENARKRQQREQDRILQMASERLVLELLPVLDNLDRALEAGGDIREGVRVTRDQLADVLGKEGLLPVASDGQTFDPNVHEAVMGQPSEEHEEGTILQTFERGYLLRGKPIRPAKVVVAKQV
jgi:molecular chaperone GrpE